MEKETDSIPEDFLCSITGEIFEDPVVTSDGETYERTAITAWLQSHSTSPNTNEELETKQLIPNRKLKSQVQSFIELKSNEFQNAFIQAIKDGATDDVKKFLRLKIKVNVDGLTDVCYAILYKRPEIAKLLLVAYSSSNLLLLPLIA
jgi:hypothetical protein